MSHDMSNLLSQEAGRADCGADLSTYSTGKFHGVGSAFIAIHLTKMGCRWASGLEVLQPAVVGEITECIPNDILLDH